MTALDLDAIAGRANAVSGAIGPGGDKAWAEAQSARDVPALVAEVQRLEQERIALAERIQQMADAERESGRQAVHRAVGLEMAADLVAGKKAL